MGKEGFSGNGHRLVGFMSRIKLLLQGETLIPIGDEDMRGSNLLAAAASAAKVLIEKVDDGEYKHVTQSHRPCHTREASGDRGRPDRSKRASSAAADVGDPGDAQKRVQAGSQSGGQTGRPPDCGPKSEARAPLTKAREEGWCRL